MRENLGLSLPGDLPPPPTTFVGEIAKTTDAGQTWTTVLRNDGAAGGQNFTYGDVHCHDESTCLVVVSGACDGPDDSNCNGSQPLAIGGALSLTTDGGKTWTEVLRDQDDPTNDFMAVRFLGPKEAYAVAGRVEIKNFVARSRRRPLEMSTWHPAAGPRAARDPTAQVSGGLYTSRASGVHVWHTLDVADPSAWKMTLVHTDLAQLPTGMDYDAKTKELAIAVVQKDQVCGVVRGYTDDVARP